MEGSAAFVEIEQHPGRARVAIAGLPDAARVQQPLSGGHVELLAGTPRLAGGQLTLGSHERQRDMGVADEADALRLLVEAQLREQRRQHVLPNGVARTGVVEADRGRLALRLQTRQEVEVGRVDDLLGPLGGEARPARELRQRDLAGHGEIVVAGQANGGVLARERHARVGSAP